MTRITFGQITIYGEKSGKCACGKRRKRHRRFYQTINPFNKNAQGAPKSADEIRAELRATRDAWMQEPIACEACKK